MQPWGERVDQTEMVVGRDPSTGVAAGRPERDEVPLQGTNQKSHIPRAMPGATMKSPTSGRKKKTPEVNKALAPELANSPGKEHVGHPELQMALRRRKI